MPIIFDEISAAIEAPREHERAGSTESPAPARAGTETVERLRRTLELERERERRLMVD